MCRHDRACVRQAVNCRGGSGKAGATNSRSRCSLYKQGKQVWSVVPHNELKRCCSGQAFSQDMACRANVVRFYNRKHGNGSCQSPIRGEKKIVRAVEAKRLFSVYAAGLNRRLIAGGRLCSVAAVRAFVAPLAYVRPVERDRRGIVCVQPKRELRPQRGGRPRGRRRRCNPTVPDGAEACGAESHQISSEIRTDPAVVSCKTEIVVLAGTLKSRRSPAAM